ncbi:hypothetical protein BS47DRAFT_323097 [Hydnum rufescens UP504]|uniref:Uncharacterized protein n=1 Tax=Hydnum rufescens UP504 TaxID=1448309 RepID=A0A9P6AK15_9AGAM|nr:hypothetical protein BS47DRAFT_323097 [Hydnum rufescens UP504]
MMNESMVQPDLMYLPPALGTTEAPTYTHNPDIEEGDKDTDLLQFADFSTIAGTSGHTTHSLPPRSPWRATLDSKKPPPVRGDLKGRSLSLGACPRSREDSAPDHNPQERNLGVLELSSTAKRPTLP